MSNARTSHAQRIKLRNRAEVEINRYSDDHALWHKNIHQVDLDPMQILKMIEMDNQRYTVDFSCRRTGKTTTKELYNLEENAKNADQELGIVAPREAQAITALTYHLEAIRRSPALDAYLAYKSGRRQIADTRYEFANRSKAQSYGIMAQVDGGDLTSASLDEVDDMPKDRLFSRFLLMLGANRRLGAAADSKNEPKIRITGVYKGADTLTQIISEGNYHTLPVIDVYLGMELGILQESFMRDMRAQLPHEEYIRQMLCKNISAKNLIWEKYIQRAVVTGVKARLAIAGPLPGEQYKKRGLISFGYDAGGHGENPHASRHALVVSEQIGNFMTFPFCRTWSAGTDDEVVKRDLVELWRYFMPEYAIGDAYGVGMLTGLNDLLLQQNLIQTDRRLINDGDSTASSWPEWSFSPMRFEGMVKHQMAQALRSLFHNKQAALPYFDKDPKTDEETDIRLFSWQLANIGTLPTSKAYPSYKMINKKLGDDLFDAAMASIWALATRGLADMPTVIMAEQQTIEQLMSESYSLPSIAA